MSVESLSTGRGPVLLVVLWVWAGLATLLYVLRAINASRAPADLKSAFGFRWDFVWATIGWINALVANACLTASVLYGTGTHQDELNAHQGVYSALWSWIGQVCAIFSMIWGRFAVIAFLRALQGPTYRRWRYALYAVGAAQALINVIEVILILNQCRPTQRLWDHRIDGTCELIDVTSKVGFLQGSIGSFADFFLALYPPAVMIGPLQQMKLRIKIALCLIMSGGVVAGIAGIIKTISIESITRTDDISYATVNLLIWVMTEVWFILIFGSLPTIRAVLYSAGRGIKARTHISARKTASSHPSRSHERNLDWMELSDDQAGALSGYRQKNGPSAFATRAYRPDVDAQKKEWPRQSQSQGWSRKDSSEEEILGPGQDEIVVTTELQITRGSEDASSNPRRMEALKL